jgi:ABC-type phosphate transport system substrate-binding protein
MRCLSAFLPLLLCLSCASARADALVVVASPRCGIERLTQDDVVNIFLGRYRRLSSGVTAEPVDQAQDSEIRSRFYRLLVNKSPAEINAYWSRLLFSGKTRPPQILQSAEEILDFVTARPGAMAYLPLAQVDSRVRVLYSFDKSLP